MNEDIAFLDWAEKLDSGTNHWLPAYGFQQPSQIQEVLLQERNLDSLNDDDQGCGSGGQAFLFLETIVEETSDDLRSESDYSAGPVGWPDSDSDSHSVIHVPHNIVSATAWNGSERDLAVPKKRRRRVATHNNDPGVCDEDDEADDEDQSPSRSSSLLQFETLERHYETIFKTSATSEPFLAAATSSLNTSQYYFNTSTNSFEPPKWTFSTFKGPQRDSNVDDDISSLSSQCSSTSSRDMSSSDNEASLLSRCSKFDNSISSYANQSIDFFRSTINPNSLKTFRSYDSLLSERNKVQQEKSNDFNSLNCLRQTDKSQSLNLNDAFIDNFEEGYDNSSNSVIPTSRSFYKTVDCLSSIDSTDMKKGNSLEYKDELNDAGKKSDRKWNENSNSIAKSCQSIFSNKEKCKDFDSVKVYQQRSAENLSEDSGFGDGQMALKGSASSLLQLRRTSSSSAVFPIPEDEVDCQYSRSLVSNQYKLFDVDSKGAMLAEPKRHERHLPSLGCMAPPCMNGESLKLVGDGEEIPRGEEGCNDAGSKFSRWQTAAGGQIPAAVSATVATATAVENCASPLSSCPSSKIAPGSSRVNRSLLSEFYELDGSDDNNKLADDIPVTKTVVTTVTVSAPEKKSSSPLARNDSFKMASRLPVVSTPNLHNLITDEEFAQIQEHKTKLLQDEEFLSRSYSLKKMSTNFSESKLNKNASKSSGSNIQITTSFVNLSSTHANGSNKGVHFCPIVSEVSWQETYSSDEESSNEYDNSDQDHSSDEDDEDEEEEDEDEEGEESCEYSELNEGSSRDGSSSCSPEKEPSPAIDALVEKLLSNAATPVMEHKQRRDSERQRMMQEYIKQNIIGGSTTPTSKTGSMSGSHSHSHVVAARTADSSSVRSLSHSASTATSSVSARSAMESHATEPIASSKRKQSNKFGGFFQRFSFRRRKHSRKPDSEKSSVSNNNNIVNKISAVNGEQVLIIPLHDAPSPPISAADVLSRTASGASVSSGNSAEETSSEVSTSTPVSSAGAGVGSGMGGKVSPSVVATKPPLPKVPPRTVAPKRSPPRRRLTDAETDSSRSRQAAVSTMSNVGSIDPTSRVGLLETDLDSNITLNKQHGPTVSKKARSLLNLDGHDMTTLRPVCSINADGNLSNLNLLTNNVDSRAKSMEFLLDKENHASIQPPENQLQRVGGDRILSEHELRVQKSLQKLNVPDWYKNSNVPTSGFILKRHSDAGHSLQHWQGLSSKTTSLSSLGSTYSNSAPPKSPTGSNRGGLMSPSPTPTHVFSRWSTTRLNSGCTSSNTSPCSSARSSFNYRQPYLGWRSQERLNKPRTPAERLAAGLLPSQKQQVQNAPSLTDVQTSIKEVTAAIVHYVSNRSTTDACNASPRWNNELSSSPSRSASPRGSTGRLCWLESSFVGSRPTEVPETPNVSELKSSEMNNKDLFLDLNNLKIHSPTSNRNHYNQNGPEEAVTSPHHNRTSEIIKTVIVNKPSPNSTTMEDVLDSLLGLPPASRSPSPGPGGNSVRRSCGDLRSPIAESANHKETSENVIHNTNEIDAAILRRVSFDAAVSSHQSPGVPDTLVRCRYNKCNKVANVSEARKTFKTCHNCAHVYCSRECRRAHWEKHRKTCLHSRVGSLCRQVLNACKEDPDSLHQLSLLARRGYLSQGRGVVKSFFSSPESAEKFVKNGFSFLGEPTFVKWSDVLPSEMSTDLYSELIRLSKNYNPDTRFVLYVAVCVVSEVPTSGAVKWERQVVSRSAKIRLCRTLINQSQTSDSSKNVEGANTLILTSLPGNDGSQRARQISFTNVQRHLRHRGVSLRRHFPDVYKNLCAYVENTTERFTPITIFPKDGRSGRTFMCIIMPDSEPELVQSVQKDDSSIQTIDISIEQ